MANCHDRSHHDAVIGYSEVQCTTKMGRHGKLRELGKEIVIKREGSTMPASSSAAVLCRGKN